MYRVKLWGSASYPNNLRKPIKNGSEPWSVEYVPNHVIQRDLGMPDMRELFKQLAAKYAFRLEHHRNLSVSGRKQRSSSEEETASGIRRVIRHSVFWQESLNFPPLLPEYKLSAHCQRNWRFHSDNFSLNWLARRQNADNITMVI